MSPQQKHFTQPSRYLLSYVRTKKYNFNESLTKTRVQEKEISMVEISVLIFYLL
jgi:hypothetical protein